MFDVESRISLKKVRVDSFEPSRPARPEVSAATEGRLGPHSEVRVELDVINPIVRDRRLETRRDSRNHLGPTQVEHRRAAHRPIGRYTLGAREIGVKAIELEPESEAHRLVRTTVQALNHDCVDVVREVPQAAMGAATGPGWRSPLD